MLSLPFFFFFPTSIYINEKKSSVNIHSYRSTDRPTDTYREYQYFGYLAMKKNEDKKKKKKLNDEDEDEDKSNWAFNNPHMAMFWFVICLFFI